jgi:hypothetical protein
MKQYIGRKKDITNRRPTKAKRKPINRKLNRKRKQKKAEEKRKTI